MSRPLAFGLVIPLALGGGPIAPVARAQPAPPPVCAPEKIVELFGGLFPPAPPEVRAASAQALGRCGVAAAAGALAEVAARDPAVEVRVSAAAGLGGVGGPVAREALAGLARGRGEAPARVRVAAIRALPAVEEGAILRGLVLAPDEEDAVRAEAFLALAAVGARPTPAAHARLREGAGPALATALDALPPGPAAGPIAPADRPLPPSRAEAQPPGASAPDPGAPPPARSLPPGAPAPLAASPPPGPPPPPPVPLAERDGTALAITSSIVAGGVWGSGLSLLARQDGPGVVTLLGSAGAVIGGGTAWGLTRFGVRPTVGQALWYTNSTAWGALAGLIVHGASGSESPKLKYGLLVGGETLGVAAGLVSAGRWDWTPGQALLANTLVLGLGLGGEGIAHLRGRPFEVTPIAAYGVVPAMLGSAIAARHLALSPRDLHLSARAALAGGWTGALLAGGLTGEGLTGAGAGGDGVAARGGLALGLGLGYLGAAAASPFVEVPVLRQNAALVGLGLGNLLGLGGQMLAAPDAATWALGAGLGGAAGGLGAFLLAPHLRLEIQAIPMAGTGAALASAAWLLGLRAGATGEEEADARVPGGLLVGGVGAGIAGLLASQAFSPSPEDYLKATTGAGIGASAGLGAARLLTDRRGLPDSLGVMGGAAIGLAGGAALAHAGRLRPPDVGAVATGGAYGLLAGRLLPSLDAASFEGGRRTSGGSYLGLGLGAAAGVGLSRLLDASAAEVGVVAAAGGLGLAVGVGAGALWPPPGREPGPGAGRPGGSRPARIGAVAGPAALMGGALLLEPRLRLSEGLGPGAPALGLFGAGAGLAYGWLAADAAAGLDGRGEAGDEAGAPGRRQRWGGLLLGGSAGLGAGLVASKLVAPTPRDYLLASGTSALGFAAGRGGAQLASSEDAPVPLAALAGALGGLAAGGLVARGAELSDPTFAAGAAGAAYGAFVGALLPDLGARRFRAGREESAGGHLGFAVGGAAALGVGHAAGVRPGQVALAASSAGLGLSFGTGVGLLVDGGRERGDGSRAPRVGAVAGSAGFVAAGLLLDRRLGLSRGLDPASSSLALLGGLLGTGNGLLLAAALAEGGDLDRATEELGAGALLAGGAGGITAGLLTASLFDPTPDDQLVGVFGAGLGATLGLGAARLATSDAGTSRAEGAAGLGGSLAGLALAVGAQRTSPVTAADVGGAVVGGGALGVALPLALSLDEPRWTGWRRRTEGGLLTGAAGGALGGALLRHAAGADGGTVALGGLGAAHGGLTGYGFGRLLERRGEDRARRAGVAIGTAAGLGYGLGIWPHLSLSARDAGLVALGTAAGAWTGAFAPALGHADRGALRDGASGGGAIAGAGAASLGLSLLAPLVEVPGAALGQGALLYGVFSGAGFGGGLLASRRDDAPVWGMLGAGTAGALAGGVLHDRIRVRDGGGPLLRLATLEGLWLGGWLPHALRDEVTSREQAGGLVAGALGGLGLGTLATTLGRASPEAANGGLVGTGIGAALVGGGALVADELRDVTRARLMLGGSAAGLAAGALLGPRLELGGRGGRFASLGAALGASEGLVFAWAARGADQGDYAGAALVGAGLGSTLGLTAAAYPTFTLQKAVASAGYSAWGAWIGAFSGALVDRDAHEVTLGGLGGANAGFLVGYGLLRAELVEPRDFGWLSLFGAGGTVLGGGVGAIFSTQQETRPVLAGLAAGPIVGMAAGAIVLPKLRTLRGGGARVEAWSRRQKVAAFFARSAPPPSSTAPRALTPSGDSPTSSDVLAQRGERGALARKLRRRLRDAVEVTEWSPFFGGLPTAEPAPGPAPFLLGVVGKWR